MFHVFHVSHYLLCFQRSEQGDSSTVDGEGVSITPEVRIYHNDTSYVYSPSVLSLLKALSDNQLCLHLATVLFLQDGTS